MVGGSSEKSTNKFLSTPSARRATHTSENHETMPRISIHALREEGDAPVLPCRMVGKIFLSTPSARRATHIQSH
mgnify:CR=1 FL=1